MRCARKTVMLVALATALVMSTAAVQADMVNGGFETGDFAGWSTQHSTWASGLSVTGYPAPYEGNYLATLESMPLSPADGYSFCSLSQTFWAEAGDVSSFMVIYHVIAQSYVWESHYFPEDPPIQHYVTAEASAMVIFTNTQTDEWECMPLSDAWAGGGENMGSFQRDWTNMSHQFVSPGMYQVNYRAEARLFGEFPEYPPDPMACYARSWMGLDDVQIIPEPATLSLLALGGLAVLRQRRR